MDSEYLGWVVGGGGRGSCSLRRACGCESMVLWRLELPSATSRRPFQCMAARDQAVLTHAWPEINEGDIEQLEDSW